MKRILPTIVISQFFCTSLWFAGNAIIPDISKALVLSSGSVADLTSAVQFGFISGTLVFAILTIADRFSPSKVFFFCSIIAALCNLGVSMNGIHLNELLLFRYLTGFFLAGIYPVGMKIAADHFEQGLGKSLGYLVGALVLGTAFPHLLRSITNALPWVYVVYTTSLLSMMGGIAMYSLVPNGPFRKSSQKPKLNAFLNGFQNPEFRAATSGYFGHMWELYTFWAFVPVILTHFQDQHPDKSFSVSFWSFCIIAIGGLSCVLSGEFSSRWGAKRIATTALLLSGICCLCSPLFLSSGSFIVLIIFLGFWGTVVIADSPMFSTLVAQTAPPASKGSALTIVNCIGFSITIISIQVVKMVAVWISLEFIFLILTIGPFLGLCAMFWKKKS